MKQTSLRIALLTTTKFYIQSDLDHDKCYIPGYRSLKQEDHKFEVSLGYTVLGHDGILSWTTVAVTKEQSDKSPDKATTL